MSGWMDDGSRVFVQIGCRSGSQETYSTSGFTEESTPSQRRMSAFCANRHPKIHSTKMRFPIIKDQIGSASLQPYYEKRYSSSCPSTLTFHS